MQTSEIGAVIVACACICGVGFGLAHAQSNNLGAYVGTIKVSGTEIDPEVSYSASIEVNLPVTQRDDETITADFYSGEAPNATAVISKWTIVHTENRQDQTANLPVTSAIWTLRRKFP